MTLNVSADTAGLPELLAEIAGVVGRPAALAIAEVKGGQSVVIPTKLRPGHWLVKAIGFELAHRLSDHFTSGHRRQSLTIPLGPASKFLAERERRAAAMAAVVDRGGSANEIAVAGGVTSRSARRFRGRYLALRKKSR